MANLTTRTSSSTFTGMSSTHVRRHSQLQRSTLMQLERTITIANQNKTCSDLYWNAINSGMMSFPAQTFEVNDTHH